MGTVSEVVKSIQKGIIKHSPEILTGLGMTGMVTTTILAVKATPKACMLIEEKKYEDDVDKLKPIDVVKTTWKCYIPAGVTCIVSIACLIGASSVNVRRNAALTTAYALSETALKEYRSKIVETIGEKKEESVRDAIAKDKIEANPVRVNEIYISGKGDTLCYEVISGRYFKSDIDEIKRAVNKVNERMLKESWNYVSLNDFYEEIGLEHTKIGYDLGWRLDQGMIEVYFSSQLTNDGTPCLVIDYKDMPMYDYDMLI